MHLALRLHQYNTQHYGKLRIPVQTSELEPGDVIDLHFTDVVCANASGQGLASVGVDGSISSGGMPGDVNGDGSVNVQDIILVVNMILESDYSAVADVNGDGSINVQDIILIVNMILGRVNNDVGDATNGTLIIGESAVRLDANGYIGGIQMTLQHGSDFSIEMTDLADPGTGYLTSGNETRLLVITPKTDELFTFRGDFEITEIIVANSQDEVLVDLPLAVSFSLSDAYPNPFNPTTTMTLTMPVSGDMKVEVYNLLGQVVSTLASGYMDANTYTLTWDASDVSSGMYFVKAQADGFTTMQKLILIK